MVDPLFWLGLSILLVAVSITAVLMAALPAFRELARAARSAEKLFDTLNRELPPTLEAIRLTSMEITELTDDMTEGVQNVGRMTQQMDQGVSGVKQQAKQAQITTRSIVAGFKAALGAFTRPSRRAAPPRPRLPVSQVEEVEEFEEFEVLEELETEQVSFANEVPARGQATPPVEKMSYKSADRVGADQAAVDPADSDLEAEEPETPHDGNTHGKAHAPQLRPSSSPQLNLPPAASPQMPPLSVESRSAESRESRRERQN